MTQPSPVPGPQPPHPGAAPAQPASTEQVPVGVAQALARLDELETTAVSEHVAVFDGVHRLLQDALATLDEA